MHGREADPEDPCDAIGEGIEIGTLPAPDIEFPGCRALHRTDVCLHHILHVHKVAGLFPVAKDQGGFFIQQPRDEFRDHRGVFSLGILAGTIDIEVAQ